MVSVSSNLRINSPSSSFAYWPLITNPREWPKDRGPLGFGAKRKTGFLPFRLGNSGNPSLRVWTLRSSKSGASFSRISRIESSPSDCANAFALATSFATRGATCFPCGRKSARLPMILLMTEPAWPLPSYW